MGTFLGYRLHHSTVVTEAYLAHTLEVGVAPCDVRLGDTQHVDGGLVQLDEHAVVDLAQPEQLKDFADLRREV